MLWQGSTYLMMQQKAENGTKRMEIEEENWVLW
jgi:hypothetical protein